MFNMITWTEDPTKAQGQIIEKSKGLKERVRNSGTMLYMIAWMGRWFKSVCVYVVCFVLEDSIL